jgi:hypothetical protein
MRFFFYKVGSLFCNLLSCASTTCLVVKVQLGVPQCMSPRQNWDSPNPSLASECGPPPRTGGGGHTRLRVRGWGSHNSDDWRKSLTLCLLCDSYIQKNYLAGIFLSRNLSACLAGGGSFTQESNTSTKPFHSSNCVHIQII